MRPCIICGKAEAIGTGMFYGKHAICHPCMNQLIVNHIIQNGSIT